ncbi:hypothetical protein JCM5350_004107 [Sporobolomyces pararoseus]
MSTEGQTTGVYMLGAPTSVAVLSGRGGEANSNNRNGSISSPVSANSWASPRLNGTEKGRQGSSSLFSSLGPGSGVGVGGGTTLGDVAIAWKARAKEAEVEADRNAKELEIARWRLSVLEGEQQANEIESIESPSNVSVENNWRSFGEGDSSVGGPVSGLLPLGWLDLDSISFSTRPLNSSTSVSSRPPLNQSHSSLSNNRERFEQPSPCAAPTLGAHESLLSGPNGSGGDVSSFIDKDHIPTIEIDSSDEFLVPTSDDDLFRVLAESTEEVAGAFKARGVSKL